ncbi:glycosyltransferase [Apibacter muscae]|uniref:glycosyltransferase family 2 protein n=1 Tax=Apibacter muscae TaxID=2509004 RepID=UPI0011AE0D12|nr:glycosyltransferase [Apibacter muscae]TWP22554.1 glycosyltransferase [Apibacter muscae]
MNYKVSVIIPVYNVEIYLTKCLNSIISQTLKEIEIICVNDGSTDNSLSILKKFESEYSNIKIINKKNGGLSDARNTGIKNASGEYLAFVDSDDWIDNDMMFNMYHLGTKYNADIVICGLKKVNEFGKIKKLMPQFQNLSEKINLSEHFYIFGEIENFACNKIFKKDLFQEIMFPVGLHFEDNATIPRLILRSTVIAKSNKYFYNYFVRKNSISQNFSIKGLDMLSAIEIVRKDFTASIFKKNTSTWKNFIIFQGFYCFLAYYGKIKNDEVKKMMFLSLKKLVVRENINIIDIILFKKFNKNYLLSLNIKKILYYAVQLAKL